MVHLAKQWNTVPSQLRCEIKGRDENRFGLFFIYSLLLLMISKYRKRSISNESFYVKFSRTHKMSASFTRIGTPSLIKTLKRSFSGKR